MGTRQNESEKMRRNRLSAPGLLLVAVAVLTLTASVGWASCRAFTAMNQSIITFDFDTGLPTLPEGRNTPFNQTSSGVTASFSSPSDSVAPAFSVQSAQTWPQIKLSQFSGKYLYDNQPSRDFLDIKFSQHITSINLTFATVETDVEPSTIKLTAYIDSTGTTPVGSAQTTGTLPQGDTYPQGILSFTSTGQSFNLVRIGLVPLGHPYEATDYFVDKVIVTTAPMVDTTPPVTTMSLSGTLGNQGWYTSDVTITLSATDDLSGVNKTEYSYDNTTWTVYTVPFTVTTEGTTAVYYKSTDNAGNIEAVKAQAVKVDKTSPATTISLSGVLSNGGWYTSNVTVTVSAFDNMSGVTRREYSFDNVTWTTYATPFIVSSQGANLVYYRSVDVAGNMETVKAQTVKVDTDNPVTSINLSGVPGNVTVTLSATDNVSGVAKTDYSFDNVTWTVYATPFIVTDPAITTVYYKSVDVAGNVEAVRTKAITADTTPPVTTVSLSGVLGDQGWFVSNVTVNLSATDDWSGVAKTEYSFDNATWANYTASFIISNEGTTTVYYRSTDAVGNVETVKMQPVKIDKTTPTGSIVINNDDASTISASVTLTLTSNDTFSGVYQVRYSNDGVWDTEQWEASSPNKTWTLTAGNGTKNVYYQIKDNAGLVSLTYQDSIIVDTTKPVADAGPDRTVNVGETLSFDAAASSDNVGIVSYEWNCGDGTTSTGNTMTHIYNNPGIYTITLTVKDAAGNIATDSITVRVLLPLWQQTWFIGSIGAIIVVVVAVTGFLLTKKRAT